MASHNLNTLVVGFNARISQPMINLSEQMNVKVASFDIIYKLTEWIEENILNMIPKIKVEEKLGRAKILAIFNKSKDEQILGGKVKEGKIKLGSEIKIMRRDFEIGLGKVTNLQKQKIQTQEVNEGDEFGIGVKSKKEIAAGDYIEAFEIVEK